MFSTYHWNAEDAAAGTDIPAQSSLGSSDVFSCRSLVLTCPPLFLSHDILVSRVKLSFSGAVILPLYLFMFWEIQLLLSGIFVFATALLSI